MPHIDRLLEQNRAQSVPADAPVLDARPQLQLAVVTCMDARIDVFDAFRIGRGDVHIVRNAGGLVTDDVVRSIAVSQHCLGTSSVMVVQHTKCGMQAFTDEQLLEMMTAGTDERPEWRAGAFDDLEVSVRGGVARLRKSPFLKHRDDIRGFVYDVDSGRVHEVDTSSV